jgi:TatD DNase family protein
MTFFNLHTHSKNNQNHVVALFNQYPHEFKNNIIPYSIGIHPWFINTDIDEIEKELAFIDDKLLDKNCLAIGECGLDKRIATPMNLQIEVFEKQLLLAQKNKKPLILHCVAAFDEVIALKKKHKIDVPIIVHGFSKNWAVAKMLLEQGFYISFGKYLIESSNVAIAFCEMPKDKIFLETDTIEQDITAVYNLGARLRNLNLIELQNQIEINFKKVFK